MPRYMDGCGTRRRIQALCCLGWSLTLQSHHAGIPESTYRDILLKNRTVQRRVADAVAATYNALWDRTAPSGYSATVTRRLAARRGWAPPMAWDDDEIDNPDAQPHLAPEPAGYDPVVIRIVVRERRPMLLNGPDRVEATRQLKALKVDHAQIAALIGPPEWQRPGAIRRRKSRAKVKEEAA